MRTLYGIGRYSFWWENVSCLLFPVTDMLVVLCLLVGTKPLFVQTYQIPQQYSRKCWWTETENLRYVLGKQNKKYGWSTHLLSLSPQTLWHVSVFQPSTGNLYTPVPEPTESCKIAIVKENTVPQQNLWHASSKEFCCSAAGHPLWKWFHQGHLQSNYRLKSFVSLISSGWMFYARCTSDHLSGVCAVVSVLYWTDCTLVRISTTRCQQKLFLALIKLLTQGNADICSQRVSRTGWGNALNPWQYLKKLPGYGPGNANRPALCWYPTVEHRGREQRRGCLLGQVSWRSTSGTADAASAGCWPASKRIWFFPGQLLYRLNDHKGMTTGRVEKIKGCVSLGAMSGASRTDNQMPVWQEAIT